MAAAKKRAGRRKTAAKKSGGARATTRKRAAKKRARTGKKAAKRSAPRKAAKRATSKRATRKRASRGGAAQGGGERLYTLTEIGKMASISMPTLQKYKRNYQDRIPSVGEGRRQRYPREAVEVLQQIKAENLAKRGRPRKRRAAAKKTAAASDDLLTLTEIGRITGISYPTLSRYTKLFLDRIPHVGSGRKRRYPKEAIAVFRQLRSESRPGRPAGKQSSSRGKSNRELTARIQKLERAVADLVKALKKPIQVTIKGR